MKADYTSELKKDIKIIKKDLRSINIKTRNLYKELEKNNFIVSTITKDKKDKKEPLSWWQEVIQYQLNNIRKLFNTNLK